MTEQEAWERIDHLINENVELVSKLARTTKELEESQAEVRRLCGLFKGIGQLNLDDVNPSEIMKFLRKSGVMQGNKYDAWSEGCGYYYICSSGSRKWLGKNLCK